MIIVWIHIQIGYKTLAVTATHATWPFLMASAIGVTPIGTINTQYTKILALNQPPHADIWIILNKYIMNYYTKSSKTVTRAATPRPNHHFLSQSEHSAESTRSKTFRKKYSWDLKFKSSTRQKLRVRGIKLKLLSLFNDIQNLNFKIIGMVLHCISAKDADTKNENRVRVVPLPTGPPIVP